MLVGGYGDGGDDGVRARDGSRKTGMTNIDVSVDDFVRVCFGDDDAVY